MLIDSQQPNFPEISQIVTPTEFTVSGVPARLWCRLQLRCCVGDLFRSLHVLGSVGPETPPCHTPCGSISATLDSEAVSASGNGCKWTFFEFGSFNDS